MKVFLFGALVSAAAASYGGAAGDQSYVHQIKQRNSHLSHPPVAHNPPLPELYTAGTQAQFTQLYGGPLQDSYRQLYGGPRVPSAPHGTGAYGQPEPEEDEYQPGYGRPAQPQRPVAPAYPQPQQISSTTRRPINYPQPTQRTTTRSPPGAGSYQNAIEDEDAIPERGYGRPAQDARPSTTRRPVTYPRPITTVRKTTTTRRPAGGYVQPARDEYIQPVNPSYPQPQRRGSTTRGPIAYPQPTSRTSTTTSRRPIGGYPGTAADEIETPSYGRPSRNNIPLPPPVYPQPVQKRPTTGGYANDIDDTDQGAYGRPQQTIEPATVIQRPSGGYPITDIGGVENGDYGRQQVLPPTSLPVHKPPTGGYPSVDLDEVEQGGYAGPSRTIQGTPVDQRGYPSEAKSSKPTPVLPPRRVSSSGYPLASELPNPAAASRPQNDFGGGRLGAENPDYFPQVSLSRAAWPAAPAVAPIPAFSAESLNYQASGHQPVEYVILDGGQQW